MELPLSYNYSKLHNIRIEYGRDLSIDNNLIEAASDRINECISKANEIPGLWSTTVAELGTIKISHCPIPIVLNSKKINK